ncbi:MAG: acyltransferase [Fimbriimonadaceae bacterium]|nr:acyltransferase [Fimbriimonadaceae bacterium]
MLGKAYRGAVHLINLLFRWSRRRWLRAETASVGDGTQVYGHPVLYDPHRIQIGQRCTLNHGVILGGRGGLMFGDDVRLSPYAIVETGRIDLAQFVQPPGARAVDDHTAAPIVIGDRVWIATGAIVLGGVTIGDGSIVAAGAVVTRDVPPGHLARGIPARSTPLPTPAA